MDFNKTDNIKTHEQLKKLIGQYKIFIEKGEGPSVQFLDEFNHLVSGNFKTGVKVEKYIWIDQTKKQIEVEEKKVQDESDLTTVYKNNPEKWRNDKVKPLSAEMFAMWIDPVTFQPLYYKKILSADQFIEHEELHEKIMLFHNQSIYKTDEELKLSKPAPPSWDKHPKLPDQ